MTVMEDSKGMVSVIIPTHNRSSTIRHSVSSVLGQTYHALECIVVDDASTDNTYEELNEINDSRLRYFRMEHNMGACAARNKGIELACGEYIAFQDSDDIWNENKLETQMKALRLSHADVCFCKVRRFSVNRNYSDEWPAGLKEGIVPYETLYSSSRVSTQTILAHKKVFDDCKFDEKVKRTQDYEWTIRAGERYRFFFVDQPLVNQYYQNDSISALGEKDYQVVKEAREYFYKKFQDKYEKYPGLEAAIIEQLAMYKILTHEKAVQEYRRLYHLTGDRNDFLKYLASKTGTAILKQCFLFKLRNRRKLTLGHNSPRRI